jgi:glycosyltransferase involved in cell wall biosynthesis
LTLIEAAALELPTIGTKVTGCIDAVINGQTGLLVEADNSKQLYEAMLTLVQDAELRKKLGSQGRQRVEQLFDSKLLIDKHISLYKGMLDKNAK